MAVKKMYSLLGPTFGSGSDFEQWLEVYYNRLCLGGGFKYFLCSPLKLGKISNLTHIFQLGGSTTNQLVIQFFK